MLRLRNTLFADGIGEQMITSRRPRPDPLNHGVATNLVLESSSVLVPHVVDGLTHCANPGRVASVGTPELGHSTFDLGGSDAVQDVVDRSAGAQAELGCHGACRVPERTGSATRGLADERVDRCSRCEEVAGKGVGERLSWTRGGFLGFIIQDGSTCRGPVSGHDVSELMGDVAKGIKSFRKGLSDEDAKPVEPPKNDSAKS